MLGVLGGGGGGWRQGKTILLRKNNDEGGEGCLACENAVLIQTITPNCHIEEMRGNSVVKIIPHCVTFRALRIP